MTRLRSAFVCLAAWLVAGTALGDRASDKAAAETLFEQARALAAEKKLDEACKKFELSQELDPAVGTLLYLADCYEQSGRTASAWATFKQAASAARQVGQAAREQVARDLAAALEPKLSRLAIEVARENSFDGFEVRRDGELVPRGLWTVPIPVDPGVRHVEARAPGKMPWSADIEVRGASVSQVSVPALADDPAATARPSEAAPVSPNAPAPAGGPAPAPVSPAGDRAGAGGPQRILGYVLGGVGIVGLGVGAVFGLQAKSKDTEAATYCGEDGLCDARGVTLGEEARSAANVATFVMIGSAVALGTGVVLVLTAPDGRDARGRSPSVRVVAGTSGSGPRLGLEGSW